MGKGPTWSQKVSQGDFWLILWKTLPADPPSERWQPEERRPGLTSRLRGVLYSEWLQRRDFFVGRWPGSSPPVPEISDRGCNTALQQVVVTTFFFFFGGAGN